MEVQTTLRKNRPLDADTSAGSERKSSDFNAFQCSLTSADTAPPTIIVAGLCHSNQSQDQKYA